MRGPKLQWLIVVSALALSSTGCLGAGTARSGRGGGAGGGGGEAGAGAGGAAGSGDGEGGGGGGQAGPGGAQGGDAGGAGGGDGEAGGQGDGDVDGGVAGPGGQNQGGDGAQGGDEGEGPGGGGGGVPVDVPDDLLCPEVGPPARAGGAYRCTDRDGDGYGEGADCLGADCNDDDWRISPGSVEVCGDRRDNNCNRQIDEGCQDNCAACGDCDIGDPNKPMGAACGPSEACDPEELDGDDYRDCLDLLCQSGICLFGYCTDRCQGDDDCQGAAEGPYGSDFSCREGVCMPGSQNPCDSDGDCFGGERCTLSLTDDLQDLEPRCVPARRCGAGPGERCNADPAQGPMVACIGGFPCVGDRCLAFCDGDGDCLFDGALECVRDIRITQGGTTANLCLPRFCDVDADCGGETVCSFGVDEDGERIVGRCVYPRDSGVAFGRACGDEIPCREGLCVFGECVRRCLPGAADCGFGSYCDTVDLCVEADPDTGECLNRAPADLCRFFPGSGADCDVDEECGDGEHCSPVFGTDGDQTTLDRRCRSDVPAGVGFGAECGGGEEGEECANRLCAEADADAGEVGYCSRLCNCSPQCGEGYACQGQDYGREGEPLGQGYCIRLRGSGDSCRDDVTGCPPGEHCRGAWLPATDGVALRCHTAQGEAADGQQCEDRLACRGGVCRREADAERGDPGYCSRYCFVDDDCSAGFRCEQLLRNPVDNRRHLRVCVR